MFFFLKDSNNEITSKKSDVTTFRGSFESVMRQHYQSMSSHVIIKLVACPSVCTDALGILSSLSPYSFDVSPSAADLPNIADVPIGAIPLLTVSSPDFQDAINKTVTAANTVYHEFLKSNEGCGFNGQIALIGDSMGAILAYDALCRTTTTATSGSGSSSGYTDDDRIIDNDAMDVKKLLVAPSPRRRSSSSSESRLPKFDFEVGDFFMFGTPLSIVLASRQLNDSKKGEKKKKFTLCYIVVNFHSIFNSTTKTKLFTNL